MTSLACSLADGELADAILTSPRPLLPPTNTRKVKDPRKVWKLVKKDNHLLVNEKRCRDG